MAALRQRLSDARIAGGVGAEDLERGRFVAVGANPLRVRQYGFQLFFFLNRALYRGLELTSYTGARRASAAIHRHKGAKEMNR